MKTILYILYRYYNSGSTKIIAYESAIFGFLLIVFINFFAAIQFLKLNFIERIGEFSVFGKYLIVAIFLLVPGYILINKFVKKRDLRHEELELKYKPIYGWLLFFYILLSVFFLIYAININK